MKKISIILLFLSLIIICSCNSSTQEHSESLGELGTTVVTSDIDGTNISSAEKNIHTIPQGMKAVLIGPADLELAIPDSFSVIYSDYDSIVYSSKEDTHAFITVNPLISKYGYFGEFGNREELLNIVEMEIPNIAIYSNGQKVKVESSKVVSTLDELKNDLSPTVLQWKYELVFSLKIKTTSYVALMVKNDDYYLVSYNVFKGQETKNDEHIAKQIFESCKNIDPSEYSLGEKSTSTYISNSISFNYPNFLSPDVFAGVDRINPDLTDKTNIYAGLRVGLLEDVYRLTKSKDQNGINEVVQKMSGATLFEYSDQKATAYGLQVLNHKMYLEGSPTELKTGTKSLIRQDFGLVLSLNDELGKNVYGYNGQSISGTYLQYTNGDKVTLIFIFCPKTNSVLKENMIDQIAKSITFVS